MITFEQLNEEWNKAGCKVGEQVTDALVYGISFTYDGKRINPLDAYKEPSKTDSERDK